MAYRIPNQHSNAYDIRAIALRKLEKSLPQIGALPIPITRLLVDEYLLLSTIKRTRVSGEEELIELSSGSSEFDEKVSISSLLYSDYSFVVAPAYKAFEGFLLFVAEEFELPVEEYKQNVGGLYNWEVNVKDKDKILAALESKLEKDKEGQDRWRELGMILRSYRHNPAHYSGDRIDSFEQAEDYVRTIINTMNQTLKYLVKKDVIYSGLIELDAICEPN